MMKLEIKSAAAVRDEQRAELKAELARVRWERQTGGLTLPNGTFVRTDDATRAALTEALNSFKAGLMTMPVPWKMSDGIWVDLGEAELLAITEAVTAHVQSSFAAERSVYDLIDKASDISKMDIEAEYQAAL